MIPSPPSRTPHDPTTLGGRTLRYRHRPPTLAIPWPGIATVFLTLTLMAAPSQAQPESVGVLVELSGSAFVGTAEPRHPASVGTSVAIGQRIRSAPGASVRLALHNGTILHLEGDSEIVIDRHQFSTSFARTETALTLLRGRVHPQVDRAHKSSIHVASATATAVTRQGEFLIDYDESSGVTHVTGLQGEVIVHSLLDSTGTEVLVTAQQVTSVRRGEAPEPARRADRLKIQLPGQDDGSLGASLPDTALWGERLLTLGQVGPQETLGGQADAGLAPRLDLPRQSSVRDGHDVSSLLGQNLADRLQIGIDLGK